MTSIIRKPDHMETPEVRRMWEECFPEGGPLFADWYFRYVYSRERTLCLFEDGNLVSNLQMIPYTLRLRGNAVLMDTLTGVATGGAFRKQGHAKAVMADALNDMVQRGQGFTFLYPFDHVFYTRLGWETCSNALEYLKPAIELPGGLPDGWEVKQELNPDSAELSTVYDIFMAGRNCCAVRDDASWNRLVGENEANDGFILMAYSGGKPAAYAFCEELDDEVNIIELAVTGTQAVGALLAYLKPKGKAVGWVTPADDRATLLTGHWKDRVRLQPHDMFRVTDVKLAFEQAAPACEADELVIEVDGDGMRPENNGRYLLKAVKGTANVQKTDKSAQFTCCIGALAGILTGFYNAGEAMEAGLAKGSDEAVELLNRIYPKQNNFLFELY